MTRLIDAERLIDCINFVQEWALAIGGDWEAIKPVNEGFISLINSQPTIDAAPKWIPVTERLPDYYKRVLFLTRYDGFYAGFRGMIEDSDYYFLIGKNQRMELASISHWMRPPELEEEECD